jgi:hypothetical protein
MANQFQDMYIGKPLLIEPQPEHKAWKVVDPYSDLFWGGFTSAWKARMYARHVLGSSNVKRTDLE